ncbi:AraC family transcriptional regulator [Paenibacillus sp. CGMCC 1.16610]|uniref:Helix-turn-helix domain-containing protein n=1 Tax=Paenibacillus anseongense TaxID=2682845 RepID=A0ABW9U5K1_9BACL|nr:MULTISPECIES: helix-turn-helix domain-containing protein [Paenibacillus]MBA2940955.1 AraC family transcriptional regulator [Paenibacillus sp. CGMCC 1.16610]MVQ34138.1 helix-turn-helix domain-containing protein [Paenibacillus anseongense]
MAIDYRKFFVITETDRKLPLILETVGYESQQLYYKREDGYPCFHWLQTIEGAGEIILDNQSIKLGENQGMLLAAGIPHEYKVLSSKWSTWYLTFDGALAASIVYALEFPLSTQISWGIDTPLANIHEYFYEKYRYSYDFTGMNGSLEVYQFLTLLKKHGNVNKSASFSQSHERLLPLLFQLEHNFGSADVGLTWMSNELGVSPQHVNTLFRKAFGLSPYQYLLQLRLQKSKELLITGHNLTIKQIAETTGFLDASHFISTFRKSVGLTPEVFRNQYHKNQIEKG